VAAQDEKKDASSNTSKRRDEKRIWHEGRLMETSKNNERGCVEVIRY
jgi:hypothetical protein